MKSRFVFLLFLSAFVVFGTLDSSAQSGENQMASQVTLGLQQMGYVTAPANGDQFDNYSTFLGRYRYSQKGEKWGSAVDVGGVLTLNGGTENHVFAPELYARYEMKLAANQKVEVTLGRRLYPWSLTDSVWCLGTFHSRFSWDSLNSVEQGLTGLFVDWSIGSWKILGMVSPLFIPGQGATVENRDGRLISSSRWFDNPAHSYRLGSHTGAINYVLNKPSVSDVVLRPSWGVMSQLGDHQEGWWVRGSYAEKPINSFYVQADARNPINILTNIATLKIHPDVANHRVVVSEAGYGEKKVGLWGGVTVDTPEPVAAREGWIQPDFLKTTYAATGIRHWAGWGSPDKNVMSWSYLRSWTEKLSHYDSTLNRGMGFGPSGWAEAALVSLNTVLAETPNNKVGASLFYLVGFSERGHLVSGSVSYWPQKQWEFNLSFDMLAVEDENGPGGFISTFRNNDRVAGNLRYVF